MGFHLYLVVDFIWSIKIKSGFIYLTPIVMEIGRVGANTFHNLPLHITMHVLEVLFSH